MGGGITPYFWRMQTDPLEKRLSIAVTDDEAQFSSADEQINPSGGRVVTLDTRAAPEYDRPYERAFLGSVRGDWLHDLDAITRVCSLVDGTPLTAGVPEGDFRVERVDRFEVLLVLRAENARQPKSLYAS